MRTLMNIEIQPGDRPPVTLDGDNVIISYKWVTIVLHLSLIARINALLKNREQVVSDGEVEEKPAPKARRKK
jgi:hypothetical protein